MASWVEPWEDDRELQERRNATERLSYRGEGFRRLFTQFDKLNATFLGFSLFALMVVDALRDLQHALDGLIVRGPVVQHPMRGPA